MNESLFDEISKICAQDQDETYNQLNNIMQVKEHYKEHALIQSINKHVARLLVVDPPLELSSHGDSTPFAESVDLLTRALVAEAQLTERDDEFHRMQGHMSDLQQALASLTSENAKLNEQLISTPIIAPALRSQRPSLTAALSSIESRHAQQIAEIEHKHAQELEHTLQYKYLFAQLASRKEDLELALELEKHKTRKTRSLIEKCIKVTEQFETQEQRLAGTVARLAHQLIEAGIPIKGLISSSATATSPSYTSDAESISGIEVFSEADRSLMAELFAPSVRATPTMRSPTTSPPRTPRTPTLPAVPAHVLTMPSSMTTVRAGVSVASSSNIVNDRSTFLPSSTNQSTAKWMSWPKGWSRRAPQPHM